MDHHCHYSGKRNRLESVPYPYLSTPCTSPLNLTHTPRNLACCVCIHQPWHPWSPCQPYAHGHFLQEASRGQSEHWLLWTLLLPRPGWHKEALVGSWAETKPLLSLWRCFLRAFYLGTALHFVPRIPKRSPFPVYYPFPSASKPTP